MGNNGVHNENTVPRSPMFQLCAITRRYNVAIAGVLALSGCATYYEKFDPVAERIAAHDSAGALKELDRTKGATRDEVLYLLNRGAILRINGEYDASNAALEQAKGLIEKLDAVSISEQAGALSVNEQLRSYTGDRYERILLHVYKALNYLEMGDAQSARVEALQIDVKLQQLDETPLNGAAFARLLTGLVYEDLHEWDNALIAYRHAYEAYSDKKNALASTPVFLKHDLLRLAESRGLTDEFEKYKGAFKLASWSNQDDARTQGEFIFVFFNNLAPIKREQAINALDSKSGRLMRISVPYYESRPLLIDHTNVRAGSAAARSEIVEDIDALARKTLDGQMAAITARAVARAVVKYNMTKKVEQQNGLLGAVVNVANFVFERADTRSWTTLPDNIQLARLSMPAGTYDISVDIVDENGNALETKQYTNVKIEAGRKNFRTYHWVASAAKLKSYTPRALRASKEGKGK